MQKHCEYSLENEWREKDEEMELIARKNNKQVKKVRKLKMNTKKAKNSHGKAFVEMHRRSSGK